MKVKYEITINWERDDGRDIPGNAETSLDMHALKSAVKMFTKKGYIEGEICDMHEDIVYLGSWKVRTIEYKSN